jgi:hypothetical protein
MVYITKRQTQSPPRYHVSKDCPMVRLYRSGYKRVTSPPAGHEPCRHAGPCRQANG